MKKLAFGFIVLLLALTFGPVSLIAAAPGKVIVIKKIVRDNGSTKTEGDFTLQIYVKDVTRPASEPLALLSEFPGSAIPGATFTFVAGEYEVKETSSPGFTTNYSADCLSTVLPGETKTCTVTNNDKPAVLTVIKNVVGGTKGPGDFTMRVNAIDVTRPVLDPPVEAAVFPGASAPGTLVNINAGEYHVTEDSVSGYTPSFSPECNGTATVGQEITCTVTNTATGGGSGISPTNTGGGGSGGGGGGGSFIPLTPTPAPQGIVAGDSTANPNFGKNDPAVLGASTTLPRTGFGRIVLLLIFVLSSFVSLVFVSNRKFV